MSNARNILLLEPNYKNKYPPIGLMKIATYHRALGDNVRFFKGDLKDLVIQELTERCIKKLSRIDNKRDWKKASKDIEEFIKTKRTETLDNFVYANSKYKLLIINCLENYSDVYKKRQYDKFPKYDRIYVTTLFTFYWKITVETIHYAKHLVGSIDQINVGGVLASLLHKELEIETLA